MALQNGWLGFYNFKDGFLTDSTGNGRTLLNPSSIGSAISGDGKPDDCWYTGSTGYLQRATTTDFTFPGYAPFSFSMFFKNPTGTTQRALFSKRGSSTQMEYSVLILTTRAIEVKIFTNASNWKSFTTAAATAHNDNTWHHLGVSYDGASIKVYYDGVEVSTNLVNTGTFAGITTGTSPLNMGAQVGSNYLNGRVDSIGIRNQATTYDEFQQLYNGGDGINYPFSTNNNLMMAFF